MAQGDTAQIKIAGSFLGQEVINVFSYVQSETGTAHPDLADFWPMMRGTFGGSWANLVSSEYVAHSVHAEWVIGGDEVYDGAITDFLGLDGGETLPPYACWSFLYRRTYRTTFNGHKRFAGIVEANQANGVAVPTALTNLNSLANDLNTPLTIGGVTYTPAIVSRILNGTLRTTPLVNPVNGVQYTGIGTQNTRKFGRGS